MQEPTDTKGTVMLPESGVEQDRAPGPPRVVGDAPLVDEEEMEIVRSAHLRFKFVGVDSEDLASIDGLIPAHLYPLLRFETVRADYPAVLTSEGEPASLTSITGDLIERLEYEGDERRYRERSILRHESVMRRLVDTEGPRPLSELWNAALEVVADELAADERESVLDHLREARSGLSETGMVVPFGREAALALLGRVAAERAREQLARLRSELGRLQQQLKAMLDVDRSETPEAHTPDNLAASVGQAFSGDFDFEALSELMDQGPHGPTLTTERRTRMESILSALSEHLGTLEDAETRESNFDVVSKPAQILDRVSAHRDRSFGLVKAVQMARLEASNQYDEGQHGPQFDAFRPDQLSKSDLVSLPITPVVVNQRDLDKVLPVLQECLDSDDPIKVLLMVETPVSAGTKAGFQTPVGQRLLAAGRPTTAIFQVSLADLKAVADVFAQALAFPGPAVVCLYVGSEYGPDSIHPYLGAAAARDARVFPHFESNPGNGREWAGRFRIERNLDLSEIWPISNIRYRDHDDSEREEPWAFTATDLMAAGSRFADGFRRIPREHWHDDLVPLHDFLLLDHRDGLVPYILMVDTDGGLYRVICSDKIVGWTERVGFRWRSLQELGGIDNSHALQLLETEKRRLADESRKRIEEVEDELRAELDQKTGVLAEQIVSNIAAGLLGGGLASPAAPPARGSIVMPAASSEEKAEDEAAVPVEAKPADEAIEEGIDEEAQEEGDEEEGLSFDEPYIETLRCTTCDECTTINPRLFAYNENKQAYIADATAGTFRELVLAAEKCPVKIIHPGKPLDPDEPHLDELIKRAEPFQ